MNKTNIGAGLIIIGALVLGVVLISAGGRVSNQGTAHLGNQVRNVAPGG